jgi:hypothetical protein
MASSWDTPSTRRDRRDRRDSEETLEQLNTEFSEKVMAVFYEEFDNILGSDFRNEIMNSDIRTHRRYIMAEIDSCVEKKDILENLSFLQTLLVAYFFRFGASSEFTRKFDSLKPKKKAGKTRAHNSESEEET